MSSRPLKDGRKKKHGRSDAIVACKIVRGGVAEGVFLATPQWRWAADKDTIAHSVDGMQDLT